MIPLTEKEFVDDPFEMIEVIASLHDWTCERSDREISILANGTTRFGLNLKESY